MVILHFILGKANPDRANGVNQVIYGLAKYQSLMGNDVHVVGISKSLKSESEEIDRNFFRVYAYKNYSCALGYIEQIIAGVDIVHLHGVWNFNNIKIGRYLEKREKPYVITAHCGYSIDRLKQSNYWIKLLYHKLWQKRLYEKAAAIHSLTREESTDIYIHCKNSNIFIVNNGVDNDIYNEVSYQVHKNRNVIRLGYLGRLSVEKNIDNLIRAIAILPDKYKSIIELNLIGPIDRNAKQFQKMVKMLGLSSQIKFVGGKYGEDKLKALLDLDVYIHPALSDVVGISVMESFAIGLPTIVTRTSHMSYFYDQKSFIMVEPTCFDLCRGIMDLIDRRNEWEDFSKNSKRLYSEIFNWKSVVEKLLIEYCKIVK